MQSTSKTILLIEDDLFLAELYERVLSSAGYIVKIAKNGYEGIKLAESIPDLILLDIMLPKMNGVEVLRKIKSDSTTREIPVILLSNLAQEDIIEEALNLGAKGYLLKVDTLPRELVGQVNTFFRSPQTYSFVSQI